MASYDKIAATAKAWFDNYDQAYQSKDTSKFSATNTPDAKRYLGPASLTKSLPGNVAQGLSNDAHEKQEGYIIQNWKSVSNKITDQTVDEKQKKAVLAVQHHCTAVSGSTYEFANVITLFFTDDGEKVKAIVEHADAITTQDFIKGEGEALRKLESA